jgi:hypothetical protein
MIARDVGIGMLSIIREKVGGKTNMYSDLNCHTKKNEPRDINAHYIGAILPSYVKHPRLMSYNKTTFSSWILLAWPLEFLTILSSEFFF